MLESVTILQYCSINMQKTLGRASDLQDSTFQKILRSKHVFQNFAKRFNCNSSDCPVNLSGPSSSGVSLGRRCEPRKKY